MFRRLKDIETRYKDLEGLLSSPDVVSKHSVYQKYAKEHADLYDLVETYRQYEKTNARIEEDQILLRGNDDELKEIVKEELPQLKENLQLLEDKLKFLLLPKDPNDDKNVFLELRAGTGGDEAGLFAGDLFRMYAQYADSKLKYESGVHRVQRVPVTESQGRIHTSAVTVAILPEAEEVEVTIDPNDLRIDVYRSSGHGGQSVNTTDSAVRITHLPTGLVVTCQDEKSQHKNKAKAIKVLRARLLDIMVQKQNTEISETRKTQVGSGDRSERIRTYNFPQGRITDHRIGLTIYNLEAFLDGDIQDMIDALSTHFQAAALKRSIS
jgi:peptide chain release factor 1